MNKLKIILTFSVIFISGFQTARAADMEPIVEYQVSADYLYRNVKMPTYMKSINSFSDLADSIKSENTGTRLFAAIRLIELRQPEAVPLLIKIYESAPTRSGIDSNTGPKYYALSGMGKIGGPEAQNYLYNLANDIVYGDGLKGILWPESADIVKGVFDGLAELGSDENREFLLKAYESQKTGGFFQVDLYAAYKRIVLTEPEFSTFEDSLYHILEESRSIKVNQNYVSPGVMSEEYIKREALKQLIVDYGFYHPEVLRSYKATLPLDDGFIKELDKMIAIVDAWIFDNERLKNSSNDGGHYE